MGRVKGDEMTERMKKKLEIFDYQKEMVARIGQAFERCQSVMVQMPTGTGKTIVLANVVSSFLEKDNRIVWVVAHRKELVSQIRETFSKTFPSFNSSHVRVMSIQWLALHYREMGEEPSLIVIDEAHHAVATTYAGVMRAFPRAKKLGLTATPYRLKGEGFTELFDVLLTSWSMERFIAKGRLSLYDYYSIRPDGQDQRLIDSLKKRGPDGDYQQREMNEVMDVRPSLERLCQTVKRYVPGKKGIVYAFSIAHAEHIAEFYRENGINAVAVSSRTPSSLRKELLERFSKTSPSLLTIKEGSTSHPKPLSPQKRGDVTAPARRSLPLRSEVGGASEPSPGFSSAGALGEKSPGVLCSSACSSEMKQTVYSKISFSKTSPSLLTVKEGSTSHPKPLSPQKRGDVTAPARRSLPLRSEVGGASEPSPGFSSAGAGEIERLKRGKKGDGGALSSVSPGGGETKFALRDGGETKLALRDGGEGESALRDGGETPCGEEFRTKKLELRERNVVPDMGDFVQGGNWPLPFGGDERGGCSSFPSSLPIQVLVSVDLFSEGFDCPDVEFIQLARPTLSLSKYLQMVGRGLRVAKRKRYCVILDNVGLYRRFGLPSADRDWRRMFEGRSRLVDALQETCMRINNCYFHWGGVASEDDEMVKILGHERQKRMIGDCDDDGIEADGNGWIDRRSGLRFAKRPQAVMLLGVEFCTDDGMKFYPRIRSKFIDDKAYVNLKTLELQVGRGINWKRRLIPADEPDKVYQLRQKLGSVRLYVDDEGKCYAQGNPDMGLKPVSSQEDMNAYCQRYSRKEKAASKRHEKIYAHGYFYPVHDVKAQERDGVRKGDNEIWRVDGDEYGESYWVDGITGMKHYSKPVQRRRGFVYMLKVDDWYYVRNIPDLRDTALRNWQVVADDNICVVNNSFLFLRQEPRLWFKVFKRTDDFSYFVVKEFYHDGYNDYDDMPEIFITQDSRNGLRMECNGVPYIPYFQPVKNERRIKG